MKEKMGSVASKAKMMLGVGPIDIREVEELEKKLGSMEEAEKKAVENFLKRYLDFNEEEIEMIKILETKMAGTGDIIYFALDNFEYIKELHYRRAAANNDEFILRDYVPPMYYERYMAIGRRATEKRAEDRTMKTQMRWGSKDIEIFVKKRGTEEQYKRVNLNEFMGEVALPAFDNSKVWRARRKNGLRRRPAVWQKKTERQGVRRQLSTSSGVSSQETERKKMKQNEDNDDEDDDEEEEEDEHEVEMEDREHSGDDDL